MADPIGNHLSPSALSLVAKQRFTSKELEMRQIAQKMGYFFHDKMQITLEKNPFTQNASSGSGPKAAAIWIPAFYLIRADDIPQDLRISSWDDPKLMTDDYLQKMGNWVQSFLGLPKEELTKQQKSQLKFNLRMLLDSGKAKKLHDFMEAHEIAHLFYQHSEKREQYAKAFDKILKCCAGSLLIGGIVFAILSLIFPPFPFVLAGSLGLAITSYPLIDKLDKARFTRACERQADVKAYKTLGNSEGGQYMFDMCVKSWEQENPFFSNHPTYLQRLKIAKDFSANPQKFFALKEVDPLDFKVS
jgi:hypothetical protein